MAKGKYLADFSVESHVCLPEATDKLEFTHPTKGYEIHLKNEDVSRPIEHPTLSVQVILEAESLDDAETISRETLRSFLELLSFATQSKLGTQKLKRVVEWDLGLVDRRCIQIDEFADPNIPFEALDQRLMESAEAIAATGFESQYTQALRWFRQGLSATYSDEQFQYFWFALEVLAQMKKGTEPVPDRCPRCREPLFCHTCDEIPTHKPYESQAIEQLIERHINGEEVPELIALAKDVRNALSHGGDVDDVMEGSRFSFEAVLNFTGRAAWAALMDSLQKGMREAGISGRLMLLDPSFYEHGQMQSRSDLTVRVKDPDNPRVEELSNPQVTMIVHQGDRSNGGGQPPGDEIDDDTSP